MKKAFANTIMPVLTICFLAESPVWAQETGFSPQDKTPDQGRTNPWPEEIYQAVYIAEHLMGLGYDVPVNGLISDQVLSEAQGESITNISCQKVEPEDVPDYVPDSFVSHYNYMAGSTRAVVYRLCDFDETVLRYGAAGEEPKLASRAARGELILGYGAGTSYSRDGFAEYWRWVRHSEADHKDYVELKSAYEVGDRRIYDFKLSYIALLSDSEFWLSHTNHLLLYFGEYGAGYNRLFGAEGWLTVEEYNAAKAKKPAVFVNGMWRPDR